MANAPAKLSSRTVRAMSNARHVDAMLIYAVRDDNYEEARRLLTGQDEELGNPNAIVTSSDDTKLSPMHAVKSKEMLRLLIEHGGDVDLTAPEIDGKTPLHTVTTLGATRALMNAGADVNAETIYGETPIFRVFYHDQLLYLVKEGGANIDHLSDQGTVLDQVMRDGTYIGLDNRAKMLLGITIARLGGRTALEINPTLKDLSTTAIAANSRGPKLDTAHQKN